MLRRADNEDEARQPTSTGEPVSHVCPTRPVASDETRVNINGDGHRYRSASDVVYRRLELGRRLVRPTEV